MEAIFLTCIQAQFLIGRVMVHPKLNPQQRNDIAWEIKQVSPRNCKFFIDAKAD